MRVRMTLGIGVAAAVAVMAGSAVGARSTARCSKTTTITFWDAYAASG